MRTIRAAELPPAKLSSEGGPDGIIAGLEDSVEQVYLTRKFVLRICCEESMPMRLCGVDILFILWVRWVSCWHVVHFAVAL